MSETDLDREPVELVQIQLPRCANVYGCGTCKAGLGNVADTELATSFVSTGENNQWCSVAVLNGSRSRVVGGMRFTASGAMLIRTAVQSAANGYAGDDYRFVTIDLTTRSDNVDFTGSGTRLLYGSTADDTLDLDQLVNPKQAENWRVKDLSNVPINTRLQLVFDMSEAADYASTYLGEDIIRLRFDPNVNDTSIVIDIHSITVSDESLYENRGSECYNTRATCQDPDNYRDEPDRSLEATLTLAAGDTIDSGDLTRTNHIFVAANITYATEPDGVIWEQGGAATDGAFLGVTSGNLIFRAGASDVASGANTGKISIDASDQAGRTDTLYGEIEFVASGTCTIRLWRLCPCSLNLVLLGEDTWTDTSGSWAGSGGGAVGEANVAVPTGESSADWNGSIDAVYIYDEQLALIFDDDEFYTTLTLGHGHGGEPTDEIYILPCLQNLSTLGSRINIAGSDDNYEPLGRRASVDFSCTDFTHSDIGQDPYLQDRLINPKEQSTFWRKWLVRQKFGKVNAFVKVLDGYAGQPLSQYLEREYLLDMAQYNEDGIGFRARDTLSLTEFRKAQVPETSTGLLNRDLPADQLFFFITGDATIDYPESGTVRINDEIIQYYTRTYSASTDRTTFGILNASFRGTDGSTAAEHETNDLVQLCRRYTAARVDAVLLELLVDDAQIPAQQVAVADIENETDLYLSAYKLTTLITEPTSVSKLIGKLSEECGFYVWWDERAQKVKMQAIRAVNVDEDVSANWTYEDNIIGGTLKAEEKPKQRLNVIDFYYNPLDFTGPLDKATNFKNGIQVINGTSSLPEQYGNYVQSRTIFSQWLSTEAEANQTSSRLAVRFSDVPTYLEFMVDAKDRAIWTGDFVTISHPLIIDGDGNRDEERRWLVVEAEELDPGHLVKYRVADITLDGTIFIITEDGIGNYTAALFAAGNAFITDNDGLNSDGTEGARLA